MLGTIGGIYMPICSKCGIVFEKAEDTHPNAMVIGTLPVLYKGVVCESCGKGR